MRLKHGDSSLAGTLQRRALSQSCVRNKSQSIAPKPGLRTIKDAAPLQCGPAIYRKKKSD